jgi:hypothetical protein
MATPSSALLSCEINLPVTLKARRTHRRPIRPAPGGIIIRLLRVRAGVQVEGLMGHLQGAERADGTAGRANPVDVFITMQLAAQGTSGQWQGFPAQSAHSPS